MKNKVPPCPTPAIDAAMEKYRQILRDAGYDEQCVRGIEAGTTEAYRPMTMFRGIPVVWVDELFEEDCPCLT